MDQWPESSKAIRHLALSWTSTTPVVEICQACSAGLIPVTTEGFTVFWVDKKPTPLTCTIDDCPGTTKIDSCRLVSIALACMWISMEPMTIVSFSKREIALHQGKSAFWNGISTAISFAVNPSSLLYSAALSCTPWRREFVMASSKRLHSRGSGRAIDALITLAIGQPWISTRDVSWPAAISRWISEYKIEFSILRTAMSPGVTFSIYGTHIQITHTRDKVFLFLMCLFASNSLNWGERIPLPVELPIPVSYAFSQHLFLHYPETAPVHSLLSSIKPKH